MTDFEILKKNYGENFAKLCRTLFPTVLEHKGVLSSIILNNFAPSKFLYDDLTKESTISNPTNDFKCFIMYKASSIVTEKRDLDKITETPEQLFKKAGYTLYKCETNDDVLSFKKYWQPNEALCTFNDPTRINKNTIFFAVKDNVDQILRENFDNPMRQDEYGTSVISLQFTKGKTSFLSIKNRYNHTVANPDATFSNDLENICAGLTDSFYKYYGIELTTKASNFDLDDYIMAADGKFYRYNREINNVYYCPNNIIIDGGKVIQLDKSRYELIDYFVLDKQNKTLYQYASDGHHDSFQDFFNQQNTFGGIEKIEVANVKKGLKVIKITMQNKMQALIYINRLNQIVGYYNENLTQIGNHFLEYCGEMREIYLPNLKEVGDFCLLTANVDQIDFPNLETAGEWFFANAKATQINLPILKALKRHSLAKAEPLELYLPSLETMANKCFGYSNKFETINLPSLLLMGDSCFGFANSINEFNAPNLLTMGNACFDYTDKINIFNAPNLKSINERCFRNNKDIQTFNAPNLERVGVWCFKDNKTIESLIKNIIKNNAGGKEKQ